MLIKLPSFCYRCISKIKIIRGIGLWKLKGKCWAFVGILRGAALEECRAGRRLAEGVLMFAA